MPDNSVDRGNEFGSLTSAGGFLLDLLCPSTVPIVMFLTLR